MEPHEVDQILRSLAATMEHQRTINERLTTAVEGIGVAIVRIDTTLARIDTTLAAILRLLPPSTNGREAGD